MKWNRIITLCVFAVVCMALSFALAEGDTVDTSVFVMPSSLRIIEESAFENTVPLTVYMSDSVEIIGDRAFAGTTKLHYIFIPESVRLIGENAFDGRNDLTIIGVGKSFAEDWARRHGYRFVKLDVWIGTKTELGRFIRWLWRLPPYIQPITDDTESDRRFYRLSYVTCSANPKEKPELYPIEYDFP